MTPLIFVAHRSFLPVRLSASQRCMRLAYPVRVAAIARVDCVCSLICYRSGYTPKITS